MISNKIKVSIIVPIYNVASFLDETIVSIISQNFKDIEIILVDDGSTDSSYAICKKYASKDSRIKLFTQRNSGVSIARNNGLMQAHGNYVFFMDADDTIDSDFIGSSYEIAKNEDADIVVIGEYYCKRYANVLVLPTCAQFLKLAFLNQYKEIRFPERIQPCEDGLFSYQLLCLTDKVGLNPSGIYNYRHHENQNHNAVKENAGKVIKQIPKWFEILEKFYKKYEFTPTQALNLAKFVEHEPFEFRYQSMPLNYDQKEELHGLIRNFMSKNVTAYLNRKDKKKLSIPFLIFIRSKSALVFDRRYKNYLLRRRIKYRVKLLVVNFIPASKVRKRLRNDIVKEYNQ